MFQIHANFHENFKNVFKSNSCEMNKDVNLHIAKIVFIIHINYHRGQSMQKWPLLHK
jgi:hypothetical protein